MVSNDLDQLLVQYPSLKYNEARTKIICEWTGHEMPVKSEAIMSYVNGKKYKSYLQNKSVSINNDDLKKFKEFLTPTNRPNRKNQLFCHLTLRHVNNQPDHIQKHLNGRRFQRSYKHWLHCQETNTKFVPFSKQNTVEKDREGDDDDDNSDNEDARSDFSDMSDLYPDDMFEVIKEDLEENAKNKKNKKNAPIENESDLMMVESLDISDSGKASGQKRKLDSKLTKKLKVEPQRKKVSKN